MDREELKEYIVSLALEVDVETVLLQEVERAEVIDQALIDRVNKLIRLQAELYENTANVLEEMQEADDEYQDELKIIDDEEEIELAEIDLKADEEYMALLEKHVKELESKYPQQTTSQTEQTVTAQPEIPPSVTESVPSADTPVPPVQNNIMPPANEVAATNHPSSAILNRPIMPPVITHQQTGPDLSNIPLDLTNLNPNPVE